MPVLAIGTILSILAISAIHTITKILRLTCLNHTIDEHFDFYTTMRAATLRTNKKRRLNAGICAVRTVRAILSICAIGTVADITRANNFSRFECVIIVFIHAGIDANAAIGAVCTCIFV